MRCFRPKDLRDCGVVLLLCGSMLSNGVLLGATSERQLPETLEIAAQGTQGLIAIQPWVQLVDSNVLGVAWMTSQPADGILEWTQDEAPAAWHKAWFSENGLKQANSTIQRAIIKGYDPSRPIRLRACSRAIHSFKPYGVDFGEPIFSEERRVLPLARSNGGVSFLVFCDIHNRVQFYPKLMSANPGNPVEFVVFNGDVLQDPQTEEQIQRHLLQPMAWFASKSIPCFMLRGNHETRGAFARRLKDYMVLPGGRYYAAMTLGHARLLFLDTGEDKPDSHREYSGLVDFDAYLEEQSDWLKREIESEAFRSAAWRVVFMHIPPDWRIPGDRLGHGPRRVRERLVPLLNAGKVTVVFSGHVHKAQQIEPCPDKSRGFQWPVFIGGGPAGDKGTCLRVDAGPKFLKIIRYNTQGEVEAERVWQRP